MSLNLPARILTGVSILGLSGSITLNRYADYRCEEIFQEKPYMEEFMENQDTIYWEQTKIELIKKVYPKGEADWARNAFMKAVYRRTKAKNRKSHIIIANSKQRDLTGDFYEVLPDYLTKRYSKWSAVGFGALGLGAIVFGRKKKKVRE